MHGFIRQLPEYRQAERTGEREEWERVLGLLRERILRARHGERCLEREGGEHESNPEHGRAIKVQRARAGIEVLEEIERAVRYGWRR